MGDEPKQPPPRVAVVIETVDGRRLKPPCPVCSLTTWGAVVPRHKETGESKPYQAALMGFSGEQMVALPTQVFVCQNCGFVLTVAHRKDNSERAKRDV